MFDFLKRGIMPAVLALCLGVISSPVQAGEISEAIRAAVDNPARSAADRERDAGRKAGEVLAFADIAPGMTVLDVFSGSGYYGEILSRVVGADGKVIAHNNEAYMLFGVEEFAARYGDDRLANVEHFLAEANDLDVGEGVADAALLILSFHDIYHFTGPKAGYVWPHIDPNLFLGNIMRSLKPGGVLAVVDHRAREGAARGTGDTLHRVDPAIVREEMEVAGFEFVGEADFLENPEDTLELSVFDPAIRGKTSRFVHLYRKPG